MNSIIGLLIGTMLIVISTVIIVVSKDKTNPQKTDVELYTENYGGHDTDNRDEITSAISSLEGVLEEMNDTFSSTVSQFEKKYALIESKIKELDLKVDDTALIEEQQEEIDVIDSLLGYSNDPMKDTIIQIKELMDKGMSNAMIAKELDMGTGEVNLIVNIMNKSTNK